MRTVDHVDQRKHLRAMRSIRPCCRAKLVQNQDDLQTLRFLIDWGGARIRAGLAIGGVVNGEAVLTDVGMMCLDQWMKGHPSQTVVFAEFKKSRHRESGKPPQADH